MVFRVLKTRWQGEGRELCTAPMHVMEAAIIFLQYSDSI